MDKYKTFKDTDQYWEEVRERQRKNTYTNTNTKTKTKTNVKGQISSVTVDKFLKSENEKKLS